MALDRFVYWKKDEVPNGAQLHCMIEDYVRGLGAEVKWCLDRFFVTLPGVCSHPFEEDRERWIEVYVGEDHVDVITRSMDAVTNAIADGLVRQWEGDRGTELAALEALRAAVVACDEIDCGDNSCGFARAKGGMRTNGGCRCVGQDALPGARLRLAALLRAARALGETDHD